MKRLLLLFILTSSISFCQESSYVWSTSLGNGSATNSLDFGKFVETDNQGNIYTVGGFQSMVDFDPGPVAYDITSNGSRDIFVQKLDANGDFLWARHFGGAEADYASGIAIDSMGYIYVTGRFRGTLYYSDINNNDSLVSNGSDDIFLFKMDSSGNCIWFKSWGDSDDDHSFSILNTDINSTYVYGIFKDSLTFNINGTSYVPEASGGFDIFLFKVDSSGSVIWYKTYGSTVSDYGYCIKEDHNGDLIITGGIDHLCVFDTMTINSSGQKDIFASKLDTAGNIQWINTIGGKGDDRARSLAIDIENNIYLAGSFRDTVDFNTPSNNIQIANSNSHDVFVLKINTNGTPMWVNTFGGKEWDQAQSIGIDENDNLYTVGKFKDTIVVNNNTIVSNGLSDIFIYQIDSDGNINWFETIGGVLDDVGWYVDVNYCNIMVTGYFQDTVDFNYNTSQNNTMVCGSGTDVYILKLAKANYGDTLTEYACGNYTSPSGNSIYNTSGFYSDTLTNSCGADSIIHIHLTVDTLNATATNIGGNTLQANPSNMDYQWYDCNHNVNVQSATNQTATFINGTYAVIVNNGSCVDTSDCISVSQASIFELDNDIKIFPNPTSGILYIKELDKLNNVSSIQLTDNKGILLKRIDIKTEKIDISKLSSGIYFLEIKYANELGRIKLIKQ